MKMNSILAALLALGLCFGSVAAHAQEDGFPFPPQAPAAEAVPVNPSVKNIESGKVMVVVGSPRHFAYHIGEVIPVTVVVSVDSGIKVNFSSLNRKILSVQGSDFELLETPVISSVEKNGKTVHTVQLLMRSWVIKKDLVLSVDFHYATGMLPDGKTPNWKPATTADFVVTTSNTVSDSEKDLLPGDMTTKTSEKPYLVRPFKLGELPLLKNYDATKNLEVVPLDLSAILLVSLLPAWLLLQLWNVVRPARKLTPSEKAWGVFERVIEESKKTGELSYQNLHDIAGALREYLGVAQVPTSKAAVPLSEFFKDFANQAEMLTVALSALGKLDRALFSADAKLTATEQLTLLREVERLVPRP